MTAALAFAAQAAAGDESTPPPELAPGEPVIVFAPESLKTALDAVAAAFESNAEKRVSVAYGPPAVLADDIERGAPADVFISADAPAMDRLEQAGLLRTGTRRKILGNPLVLVELRERESKLAIGKGFDLPGALGDGKLAVCSLDSCPAGKAAKETLSSLEIFASIEPKLSQTDAAPQTLDLVANGTARFGIVYAADAKAESRVRIVSAFPQKSSNTPEFSVALIEKSPNPDAAFFVSFLKSQAATKIFSSQGYTLLAR
ncbi:MAG TPA: molybdate ABC transporter substrate-binding protein [Methylocella sp.]|nr:molybdate ABC transporter substrate-binding protein [Methylocella sp.]